MMMIFFIYKRDNDIPANMESSYLQSSVYRARIRTSSFLIWCHIENTEALTLQPALNKIKQKNFKAFSSWSFHVFATALTLDLFILCTFSLVKYPLKIDLLREPANKARANTKRGSWSHKLILLTGFNMLCSLVRICGIQAAVHEYTRHVFAPQFFLKSDITSFEIILLAPT